MISIGTELLIMEEDVWLVHAVVLATVLLTHKFLLLDLSFSILLVSVAEAPVRLGWLPVLGVVSNKDCLRLPVTLTIHLQLLKIILDYFKQEVRLSMIT